MRFPSGRRNFRLEARPIAETPLFPEALPTLPAVQQPLPFDKVISILSARIDRHEQRMDAKLERLLSTQLTVCEQLKDLRMCLPMQRRPLSGWGQRIHVEVLNAKRGGLCPCCEEVRVCSDEGRMQGAPSTIIGSHGTGPGQRRPGSCARGAISASTIRISRRRCAAHSSPTNLRSDASSWRDKFLEWISRRA